jgi:hypothetical protein
MHIPWICHFLSNISNFPHRVSKCQMFYVVLNKRITCIGTSGTGLSWLNGPKCFRSTSNCPFRIRWFPIQTCYCNFTTNSMPCPKFSWLCFAIRPLLIHRWSNAFTRRMLDRTRLFFRMGPSSIVHWIRISESCINFILKNIIIFSSK